MCGVAAKRWTSDLNVTGLRPPLATRHIRYVLLVNSPTKLNLLSWLLIYLCSALHQTFYKVFSDNLRLHARSVWYGNSLFDTIYDYDYELTLFEYKQNQHIHIIKVQYKNILFIHVCLVVLGASNC